MRDICKGSSSRLNSSDQGRQIFCRVPRDSPLSYAHGEDKDFPPDYRSQTVPALQNAHNRAFPQPYSLSERRPSGSNNSRPDTGRHASVGYQRSSALGTNSEGSRGTRPQGNVATNASPLCPKPSLTHTERAAMLRAPFTVQPNHILNLTPYKHSRHDILPEPSWLLHGIYRFLGPNKDFTAYINLLLHHLSNNCPVQGLRGVQAEPPRFSGTATVTAIGC